ncbi:hypothetical protein IQ235_00930 [Oscillatoriales cyanobacterium LEGE 11467]|uniref:Uncharacterized protein n=1 Tax=Zarconia navalis LEGE 11467 TaxID=1828826 RepID=A0A928VTY9_9CYAN|nr:hypothetical protein [Zarconia navalis]MBE9039359.1 hypothetical protein [Zarconia navalis LEGE 11467]
MVNSEIVRGQIRTEKVRELRGKLKGQTFKADRAEVWADRQLVKLGIEQEKLGIDEDNLKAVRVDRQLNQQSHIARLSAKAYSVDATTSLNQGKQQFLLNAGVDPTVVTLDAKAKMGVKV